VLFIVTALRIANLILTFNYLTEIETEVIHFDNFGLISLPFFLYTVLNRTASEADTSPGGRTESECESNSSPDIDSPHSCFRKLRFLNLNSTLLATWDDVERLSRFPELQCLRLQGCPLFEVRDSFCSHDSIKCAIIKHNQKYHSLPVT
jgi:hypothetical protein